MWVFTQKCTWKTKIIKNVKLNKYSEQFLLNFRPLLSLFFGNMAPKLNNSRGKGSLFGFNNSSCLKNYFINKWNSKHWVEKIRSKRNHLLRILFANAKSREYYQRICQLFPTNVCTWLSTICCLCEFVPNPLDDSFHCQFSLLQANRKVFINMNKTWNVLKIYLCIFVKIACECRQKPLLEKA